MKLTSVFMLILFFSLFVVVDDFNTIERLFELH